MPYIFAVNEPNYRICIDNHLFGVPDTERARSQISNVRKGDRLFIYVYGSQRIYGVYEAISDPFIERELQKGPWNYTATDERHGYYPYRLFIDIIKDYQQGIPFQKIEQLNIGLDRNLLLRKSVIYITDFQTNIIEELLKELPVKPIDRFKIKTIEEYESLFTQPIIVGKSEEKALQILVQNNLSSLENGLKAVISYFNVQYGKFKGEIDILARDKNKNFVVTEIKAENLKRDIWSQLFSYSHIIRNIYAKFEDADVRSFLICSGFDIKTVYSYPEIKKLLRREDSLRVFKYQTDFKRKISFEEIPIVLKG